MGLDWGSLIGGAAGGVLDIFGQVQSRRESKDAMYHTQQWETDMSNTAYQRAVADMRAAGLNPMLAYSRGGASTPSGSAPSFQPTEYGKGVSSALQAKQVVAATENTESQSELAKATALKEAAVARGALASAAQTEKLTEILVDRARFARDQDEVDWNLRNQRGLYQQHGFQLRAQETDRDKWYTDVYGKRGGFLDTELENAKTELLLKQLTVPGARNEAEVDESDYGKERPYIRDAGAIAGGAASAAGAALLLKNLLSKPRVIGGVRQGPSHRGSWRNGRESRMDKLLELSPY